MVDLNLHAKKSNGLTVKRDGYLKTYLCLSKYFSMELYDVEESFVESSDSERFYTFTCVEGKGNIIYEGGSENIKKGDSIMIPAALGKYTFKGKMKVLKSYVPNVKKVEKEILSEVIK